MVAVELPPEVIAGFVAEARSYLPAIRQSLESVHNATKLEAAYRYAHTIKSSAAMMGHVALSQVAELLEGDLEGFQLGEPALPSHLAQLVRSLDRIAQLLDGAAGETIDLDAIIAAEVADRTAASGADDAPEVVDVPDAFISAVANVDGSDRLDTEDDAEPLCSAPLVFDETEEVDGENREDEGETWTDTRSDAPDQPREPNVDAGTRVSADPEYVSEASEAPERPADAAAPPSHDTPTRHSERSEESAATASDAPRNSHEAQADHVLLRSARVDKAVGRDDKPGARDDKTDRDGPAADVQPEAISLLLDELAESVLTLGREVTAGRADLASHHDTLADWLGRFEQAADLPCSEPLPPVQVLAASRPTLVELDPEARAEEPLRRAIETELRFQIEEEVRGRLALEASRAPKANGGVRLNLRPAGRSPAAAVTSASVSTAASTSGAAAGQSAAPDGVEIDAETREVFALEAAEHLKRIDADAAALGANPADKDACAALRRSVHTLKGAAAMMGFQAVASLAHSLEDRLDAAVAAGVVEPHSLAGVLQDLDQLELLVQRTLSGNPADSAAQSSGAVASPASASSATAIVDEPVAVTTVPVRLDHLDDLLRVAGETSVTVAAWPTLLSGAGQALLDLRRTVTRAQTIVADLHERRLRGADPLLTRAAGGAGATRTQLSSAETGFDPLELDRYTEVDYLLHDLAEIATDAHSAERELASVVESAGELVTGLRHQAGEMQERLLASRLVPLDELASRLSRAVLGVAAKRHKQIDFAFTGGDVVVDRAILDSVADALIHLVRNASDHGIEAPPERRAHGKPETGTVHVSARQEQGEVVVEVSDDGQGVDPSRMGSAARAAGLDPAQLTVDEAIELIFLPGVSTAGVVDDVSGRGVGLDAVRATIERVRGSIEVVTEPGQGTIFALRFPVTLAQARVVMIEVAGNPLAIPAANVKRLARLSEVPTEQRAGRTVALHDGDPYPVSDLAVTLGLVDQTPAAADPPLLFVESVGARAALLVGEVTAQQEVVVKQLGSHLRSLRGVSGATLLQDGRAALVLHLPDVLASANANVVRHLALHPSARGRMGHLHAGAGASSDALRVLVVDDSPTIRKLLVRTLKDLGWRPEEAKDGVEALERVRVGRPDVVLADIEMPHLDGYGLLAALRAKPETASLPVVMLTSRTAERHRQRAAELGANGYLTKPYRPADVAAALRRFARTARDEAVA